MEKGDMLNTKIMISKLTQDQGNNPLKKVVLNNVYKVPERLPEIRHWSIFTDNVRYVQHDNNDNTQSGL